VFAPHLLFAIFVFLLQTSAWFAECRQQNQAKSMQPCRLDSDRRVVIGVDVRSDREGVLLYTPDHVASVELHNEQGNVLHLSPSGRKQRYRKWTCAREELGYMQINADRARVHPFVYWNAWLTFADDTLGVPIPVAIKFNSRR